MRKGLVMVLLFAWVFSHAQPCSDSSRVSPERMKLALGGGLLAYSSAMTGLYFLWYAGYPQSSFHFFNDNHEWLYMDKIGHAATGYYLSRYSYESFCWTGLDNQRSALYGSLLGFGFLTTIEVFDGFSAQWGASGGDIIANTLGTSLFLGQQLVWKEQKALLKFSWHNTQYPVWRPNVLGRSLPERILKDYNGQTYWLSINLESVFGSSPALPYWLNLAIGYSADGMLGGPSNPISDNQGNPLPVFTRSPQFFLSLDADLTRIKTRSKTLNLLLKTAGFIKIPFPTIEYMPGGYLKGYGLYF